MNKSELIEAVAERSDLSKADVAAVVGHALDVIQEAVAKGDRVTVAGFGTFERRFREGGERRNPQGGTVTVASRHVPAFKAGATFKAAVSAA